MLRGAAGIIARPAHRFADELSWGVLCVPGWSDGMEKPAMTSLDSFKCAKTLTVGTKTYVYYSLPEAEKHGLRGISRLPFSLKVLLENLLRNEDGRTVTKEDISGVAQWLKNRTSDREIAFRPARVLMQ